MSSTQETRLESLSRRLHSSLESFFYNLTGYIVAGPWTTIGFVVVLTLGMAQGVWFYDEELSSERQFVPPDVQAVEEQGRVENAFGFSERQVRIFFVSTEGNILTRTGMGAMFRYMSWLNDNVVTEFEGDVIDFEAVCTRDPHHDTCRPPTSVLSLWDNDVAKFERDPDLLAQINDESEWRRRRPRGPKAEFYLGGVTRDTSGGIVAATAAELLYTLQNNRKEEPGVGLEDMRSRNFEIELARQTRKWQAQTSITVHITTAGEAQQAYEDSIDNDMGSLVLGYTAMVFFACFVLFRGKIRESHSLLGLLSVVCVGMSTVSAYGMCWILGIKMNTIVQVLVVVLLGVGVDDTFVIMDSWYELSHVPDMKERMQKALGHAGAAITVTSLTDLIAFLTGSSSRLPALRDFCYYAAFGILFDFAYQCTLFVAMAYLDSLREQRGRADCCCCVSVAETAGCWQEGPPCVRPEIGRRGLLQHGVGVALPRFTLGTRVGRLLCFGLVIVVLSVGALGLVTELQLNYNEEWLVPEDDILQDDYEVRNTYFAGTNFPFGIYFFDLDFSSESVQDIVDRSVAAVEADSCVVPSSGNSWQASFLEWLSTNKTTTMTPGGNLIDTTYLSPTNGKRYVTSEVYYELLQEFVSEVGPLSGRDYVDNLKWSTSGFLTAARGFVLVTSTPFADGAKAIDCLKSLRDQLALVDDRPFIWAFPMLFWEQYSIMVREIVQNVAVAGSCVLVVVTILVANLTIAALITLTIGAVDISLLGFMPWVGVDLNGVSLICIVIAIGFAVDYSVHIAHAFLQAQADDTPFASSRAQRAAFALHKMGPAVVNGGISTFLAVAPLSMASSYGFQVFFKMFALIIGFGLLFGVIMLPLFLALCGPKAYSDSIHLKDFPWMNPLDPRFEEGPPLEKEMPEMPLASPLLPETMQQEVVQQPLPVQPHVVPYQPPKYIQPYITGYQNAQATTAPLEQQKASREQAWPHRYHPSQQSSHNLSSFPQFEPSIERAPVRTHISGVQYYSI